MGGRAVGRAIVGHQPLDRDPVRSVEGHRSPQEADDGLRLLVGQHLGIGQAGGVIDANVNPVPAGLAAPYACSVRMSLRFLGPAAAEYPVTGPVGADPAELLDVDMDQLARPAPLVSADRLLGTQAAELAQADSLEHRGDG